MTFKKHNWMRYGGSQEIVEIKVKGDMRGVIDFFRVNNNKDSRRIGRILKDKYQLDFTPEEYKEEKEEVREDKEEE